MKREVHLWNRIVAGISRTDVMLVRVENAVSVGFSDAIYTIEGVTGFLELKCPVMPKRATTALFSGQHKLSIEQRNFLLCNRQAGGIGYIAIETEEHAMLIGARYADRVNVEPLARLLRLSDWCAQRPLSANDWGSFAHTLKGNESVKSVNKTAASVR